MITKAFYNGEYISVNKIGKLVGVTGHHLVKYFRKCGNIEEAIKIAKDEQQKQKGTIEYNGEILSIKKIADKEGLQHSNLAKHYKNLGNIYDAVIKAKDEKQKQRGTIKYKNEITNIKQIAINEGLTASSLRKHYNQLNNIEEAIKIAKQEQIRQQGTIEYNGSIMTINKIASIEKLTAKSLSIYYEELGNIYDAVNMTKQDQEKHNGNVLYNNQKLSIAAIAKLENINHKSLKKYYEETKDIYKAVLILKNAKQNIRLDARGDKSYTNKVNNKINKSSKNLYNYCLENNINYYVIYYMMKKNNITFEEAVKIYNSKGQNIPTNWIYEEYNLLLKHLLLKYNIDSRRITDIMKEDCICLEKAIEKYIFMKNMSCKSNIMRSYLYDAYLKVTNVENNKFISTIEKLHLNSAELKEFDNCYNEVQLIKRKLLLYEFASIINEWDIEDIVGMMRLYSISIGEIKEIFIELYKPFYDKILFPKNSDKYKRNCIINELINKWNIMDVSEKDLVIQKYSISREELYYINNNSNKMNKIINLIKS